MSEVFLAEAAVAVVPDLTAFRAKLIADLKTATAGVVATVNVAASKASTAAAAATTAGGAANQAVGAKSSAAAAQARVEEAALNKLAAANKRIELAGKQVLATDSAIAAKRVELTAATRAVTLTSEALATVTRETSAATVQAIALESELAIEREAEALAAFNAAKGEKVLAAERAAGATTAAARQAAISKGFASQAAAAAGLRGATLAASGAFIGGTVAAVAFFKAVSSAAALESELNVFAVTAGATADEMARVSEEAQALGRDITLPGVSASDAAEAFTELAKAGLSVEDSLSGARGVLQLATAAQITNAEATVLTASALNAFGLAGTEAVHVADLLANAANASQGSIGDMGLSLQQASAVARQVGVSLDDTVALLTLLAQNGIRGSDAGTSLRVAFTKLINPTDRAAEVLGKLNVNIRDAAGNVRPEVFSDFLAAQQKLTKAEQDRNAGIVFGTDALRAYAIISREGAGSLDEIRAIVARQGTAAEVAAARMEGLTGASENLKNQLSALGLTLGNVVLPPLTLVTEGFARFFGNINSGIGSFGNFLGSIPGLAAAFDAIKGERLDLASASSVELTKRIAELSKEADHFKESGDFIPPRITNETRDITDQLILLRNEIKRTGSTRDMDRFFRQFTDASPQIAAAFKDGIITPAEQAALSVTALGRAFLEVAPDSAGVTFALDDLGSTLEAKLKALGVAVAVSARQAGFNIGSAFAAGLASTVAAANNQLSGLARAALDIDIAGGPNEQARLLANLEDQERQARAKVAARERQQRRGIRSNEPVKAAKEELARILDQQDAIRATMKSDAEAATNKAESDARELQEKLNKADRAVVDAVGRREGRQFNQRTIRVDNTKILSDNRQLALDQAKFYTAQIEVIKKTVKDAEIRADALENLRDKRREAVDRAGDILKQMREDRESDAETARATVTERLEARLQIAESRGGKDAILAALDAVIANAEKQVRQAKKGTRKLLDAQVALAGLNAKRRDLLKEAEKGAKEGQGTSAFDLLQQFAGRFGEIGGNLINGQQPFVGPSGFTADIAQFLKRQQGGGITGATATGGKTKFDLNDDKLTRALDRLTDAILEQGGGGEGSNGQLSQRAVDAMGERWNAAARFYQARHEQKIVEAGA